MTSFSLFIYYIAQLTLQLEMYKDGLFENASDRKLLLQNSAGGPGDPSNQNSTSALTSKYGQQPKSHLKPLFIVFNTLAYIAYIITIFAFILSKKSSRDVGEATSDVIDNSSWLSTFYRIVAGINGLCFFLLTISLLNYGSRLEKCVHFIKFKAQH